ncbi:hypothetical protein [Polymorphobacter megasporae]|uniref:hypothetical protein n=1 Tax=Glacieibacterium megasporae TaxID=2835787 RepID=UPI001C1E1D9E|nr:hypothetical protein [Polymorphobacter megasporae]UAJ12694.1 hypothetical protein KTC28_19285 [Polymorphobacter megasporae]
MIVQSRVEGSVNRFLESRWIVGALLILGLVLRLAWLRYSISPTLSIGEALNVARDVAEHGVIGDAFRQGQGPTAHVMPIPPLIAGGVYRILGFQTRIADDVLTLWSLLLIGISIWFFDLSFRAMGSPPLARVVAIAFICVVPLNFALEVSWFRVWDGGLAVAAASIFLFLLVTADGRPADWPRIVGLAIALALLFFIQPNFGLAGIVCAAMFMFRNISPRRWVGTVAAALIAAIAVFAPWTIRNFCQMGSPIILRSNFGLEMALAFYPEAVTTSDQRQAYFARHQAIHPYEDGGGYEAMERAGGEVLYAKQLGAATSSWMAAHPAETFRLAVRHFVQTLFPPRWYWTMFSNTGSGNSTKQALNWLISGLGVIGIVNAIVRLDFRYCYAASLVGVTLLPFMLVQPTLRYRYLVFALLVFFSTDVLVRYGSRLGVAVTARWSK